MEQPQACSEESPASYLPSEHTVRSGASADYDHDDYSFYNYPHQMGYQRRTSALKKREKEKRKDKKLYKKIKQDPTRGNVQLISDKWFNERTGILNSHTKKHIQRQHTLELVNIFFSFIVIEKTFREVPPIVENGEQVEVQVLEEVDTFDPDEFLRGLEEGWKQQSCRTNDSTPCENAPTTRGSTEIKHFCPVHGSAVLQLRQTTSKNGCWRYYKCPVENCFVRCAAVCDVTYFLSSAKRQLHEFYLNAELTRMSCYCALPLDLKQSHSKRKTERMFFGCSKRSCGFFQWADKLPNKNFKAWLLEGIAGPDREGYPRPEELLKPCV